MRKLFLIFLTIVNCLQLFSITVEDSYINYPSFKNESTIIFQYDSILVFTIYSQGSIMSNNDEMGIIINGGNESYISIASNKDYMIKSIIYEFYDYNTSPSNPYNNYEAYNSSIINNGSTTTINGEIKAGVIMWFGNVNKLALTNLKIEYNKIVNDIPVNIPNNTIKNNNYKKSLKDGQIIIENNKIQYDIFGNAIKTI